MSPDDRRHGTRGGYQAGCRSQCCRVAMWRYEKRLRLDRIRGVQRTASPLGTTRRLQALTALGWDLLQLAKMLDRQPKQVRGWIEGRHAFMFTTSAALVADLYDEICMTLPPELTTEQKNAASRARGRARRNGWPPPLAWDDIDTDPEPTWGDIDRDVDPVVVMRLLEGVRIKATTAERKEAMRQWLDGGGSEAELCRAHGWKAGRYGRTRLEVVA